MLKHIVRPMEGILLQHQTPDESKWSNAHWGLGGPAEVEAEDFLVVDPRFDFDTECVCLEYEKNL